MSRIEPSPFSTRHAPRVAVLIDGENIAASHAKTILRTAETFGPVPVRRCYGDVARLAGWEEAPGLRLVHSGRGKNAADLCLTVDAMELALTDAIDVLAIASSDGDFHHLATHLREKGLQVIGIGEAKTSSHYRACCSRFVVLEKPERPLAVEKPERPLTLDERIAAVIRECGDDGIQIARLNGLMRISHDVRISTLPEKTWRAYLAARPKLFQCDPKGPQAKVRSVRP